MKAPIRLSLATLLLAASPLTAQEAAPVKAAAPAKPARSATQATTVQAATPRTGANAGAAAVPLSERVAVIGVLDKRLGSSTEFKLKPGESFRFGQISGVLQSCETTQPYERKQSGAFVQVTETPRAVGNAKPGAPKLVFSGWIFAESPSLNPFVHPVYDVWLKSCTMRFPDGPKSPANPAGNRTSGARKSGAAKPAAASAPAPAPAAPAAPPPTTPEG